MASPKFGKPFCALNINRDIKNFVQILVLLQLNPE